MTLADQKQLQILQHSIGADEYGRRKNDRNHFVTGAGSTDHPHCMALVDAGLMTRTTGHGLTGGADLFHVTPAGKKHVAERSPPPPKLTRSQRRYDAFLAEDCGLTFGEWLRSRAGACA